MLIRKILLAEDDDDDQELFNELLFDYPGINILPIVENGERVMKYLDKLDEAEIPDAIILDQNMPLCNGLQTLKLLKDSPRYAQIVVMLYSTYVDENLLNNSKMMGAVLAVSKPSTQEGYIAMMDRLLKFL